MTSRDFRISVRVRTEMNYFNPTFPTGNNLNGYYRQAQEFAYKFNKKQNQEKLSPANLNASAILHTLYQSIISRYLKESNPQLFSRFIPLIDKNFDCQEVLAFYSKEFPSPLLTERQPDINLFTEETIRGFFVHQILNQNNAMKKAIKPLIDPKGLIFPSAQKGLSALLGGFIDKQPTVPNTEDDLFTFLITPALLYPDSIFDQIRFILENWKELLSTDLINSLLKAIDYYTEETKPPVHFGGGKPETYIPNYNEEEFEAEAFSEDRNWMPNVVMMAKSTLVWLDQLSKYYNRPITTLDQIPDEELDNLQKRGFTALWLIGLWERSDASKKIKNLCGNEDAEASAYSLKNDEIAYSIGGWGAIENLRERCKQRGIRLASDMVPNHTGIDSDWVVNHPEYFIQQSYPPFPNYTYNGPDLSSNPDIEIKLEDHYYDKTDAAVTFRRKDKRTGETTYIFHGNDGTSMPWNDTAQLDFLNPLTREAVYQQIVHVAQNFPIIRFDAAMTLAKKHIQRLWYPKPGTGGDIAGRTQYSLTQEEFNKRIPTEFWREVVDRMSQQLPDTLLLAEAFWMMEGYFVRTLGMHRVYNSAFMNMLKNQENKKYKDAIKATIAFEPEILKRYVNFMSNPDEETAIGQFGDSDKYFGVCTLLSTMPGLPMFGHGQIEGLKEKYGMEYRRAYWDEWPASWLIEKHNEKIFPLLKKRYLYSGVENFNLYDLIQDNFIHESAFCYSNGIGNERSLVLYNNQYERVEGYIKQGSPKLNKAKGSVETTSLAENLKLNFSGRRFMLYKNFNNGLTYLIPSLKVYEEGLWVSLNGFETIVLTEIREVEDVDGTYSKLYSQLKGKGIKDLNREINAMRLEPVFEAMNGLRSPAFIKLISKIMKGEGEKVDNRKIVFQLAEAYSYLPVSVENMSSAAKTLIPCEPKAINPSEMLEEFSKFANLFKDKETLNNSTIAMDELVIIISGALFMKPFISEEMTIEEIDKCCSKLLLPFFYEELLENRGFFNEELIHACQGVSLYLGCYKMMEGNNFNSFKTLFDNELIRRYASCNEYKDIVWYKKESVQDLIILSGLSKAMFTNRRFNIEKYISENIKRESLAEYKLEKLLEGPKKRSPRKKTAKTTKTKKVSNKTK